MTTPKLAHEAPVHKPSCGYLCSGDDLPPPPCDCGAVPQRTLVLTMGVRSCQLVAKALGRLDTDEVREAKRLGLTGAVEEFLSTTARAPGLDVDLQASSFGTDVEELWQATNARWGYPLDLKNVWKALGEALKSHNETPEERRETLEEFARNPDEPPYGIGSSGQHDEHATIHVFACAVVLGLEPDARVTVGIARGSGFVAEAECFWPELRQTSGLWKHHAPKWRKWAEKKADDRHVTTRRVAERLLELLSGSAFRVEARTKE